MQEHVLLLLTKMRNSVPHSDEFWSLLTALRTQVDLEAMEVLVKAKKEKDAHENP